MSAGGYAKSIVSYRDALARARGMDAIACVECGALVPSGNATLHALRCLGPRRAPDTSSPPMASKKQKVPNGG